jgi:hypothetical protein
MPSFLSKVFGRKKDASPTTSSKPTKRTSAPSLLEGKYEAVSPTVSPSAAHFADFAQKKVDREKDKERDGGLTLFRGKSRLGDTAILEQPSSPSAAPQLSLHLPAMESDKRGALLNVFETGAGLPLLSEEAIGTRTLDIPQTISLVRACAKFITERGGWLDFLFGVPY